MIEKTVNVPFVVSIEEGANVSSAYAFEVPGATVAYGSTAAALAKMRDVVVSTVKEAVKVSDRAYTQRRLVACKDGTILVAGYWLGGFGYCIAHADRSYASGCYGVDNFESAVADAKRHAETGFGGVAWECTL